MMDEFVVSYSLDSEQQFWDELGDICSAQYTTSELIDQALRTYLHFTAKYKDEYLPSSEGVDCCIHKLLDSALYIANKDYVRTQLVYSLLQDDEAASLYIIASFLLCDGLQNEETFEMMNVEGAFPRLVDLIKSKRDEDHRLHRRLLELLYEMSRLQRLSAEDLAHVDDGFIGLQFQNIEQLSDDSDDPYHYPVIRVLLVLNEQYMVAATTASDPTLHPPPTNRVIKVLSVCGQRYMTFGENIILLLNRETETSLQLLILKLLYLLFTTQATHDYFYTNDLRVLVDVIIRNLLDLPNELVSLRHTYLRVLHPLLAYTQLANPPYYKRDEIIKVLSLLGGSSNAHFAPADDTTVRLVERVAQVPWLRDDETFGESALARKLLGTSLTANQEGSASVVDLASVTEKPGVQTPSRRTEETSESLSDASTVESETAGEKTKPPPPPAIHHGRKAPPAVPPPRMSEHHKKLPPKTPPRRRTKLKHAVSTEKAANMHE